jgi:monoamine oxidase
MARTPLLRTIKRLAFEHTLAQSKRMPVEQVRAERRGIGRRSLLQGVGAAAAVMAVSRPGVARASGRAPRIAIVGGGISGLNAALTLQDAGFASTVYEASSRVGGRMHSNDNSWLNKQTSEWCGEFIDSGHATLIALAQRFNLPLIDEVGAQPANSEDTLFFFHEYYPAAQADADFQPLMNALNRQNNDAPFPTLYNSFTAAGKRLDEMSLYDWIEKYVKGGHASPLGAYLDSAYNQEFGLDTNEQSSLNIVYELGFQPTVGGFSIYGYSDQRFHILGGNELLPQAIAATLRDVVTRWTLTELVRRSDGTYSLTFATPNGTREVVADHVILAMPFSVLRGLDTTRAGFDPLKNVAIAQLGYGTNTKLSLQFDERYWNTKGPWGTGDGNIYTDLFFQNAWDSSRGIGGESGVLTAYMGGSNGASFNGTPTPYSSADTSSPVTGYAQALLKQLEKPWPGISRHWNGRATLSTPWRDPNLLGSYSCWTVGQYTLFSGYEGVRQANCHFAGEHCSTNFQGFMEGAAEEGARAAQEIIADYGGTP